MRYSHSLLIGLFLLGIVLRIYQLGSIPVGLHGDEASIGYSAYSLLKTGRDETGARWPLAVNQFGDYRPAGYYYLDMPFIAALGLNELAVRLPSAIIGALSILVFYALVYEVFHKKSLSLLAAGLLTISPWHVIISRATSEGVVSALLILLGTVMFLKAIRPKHISSPLIILSIVFFLASFFFYHAARVFVPLLFPLLVIFSLIRSNRPLRKGIPFIFLFGLIIGGVLFVVTTGGGLNRAAQVGIFHVPGNDRVLTQQIAEDAGQSTILTRFFHNKWILNTRMFLTFYFQHFSGEFLFATTGKPVRYTVPWSGNLYIVEIPFLLFGFSVLLAEAVKKKKYWYFFPLFWLALGAVPAGVTWEDTPNIQRASLMIPGLYMIIAVGIHEVFTEVTKKRFIWLFTALTTMVFFYSGASFFHIYFHHLQTNEPWHRSAAVKELVHTITTVSSQYSKVIMTTDGNNNFIHYLFYNRVDPTAFLASGAPRERNGLMIGNIQYVGDPCPLRGNSNAFSDEYPTVLFVNSYSCKDPVNVSVIRIVHHPDGAGAYKLLQVDAQYEVK